MHGSEIGLARTPVKALKIQTETQPLFVVFGVQVFGQD
jgi:hypothetical protein